MGFVSEPEPYTLETSTVLAWHDALNSGDADSLVQLTTDDVELGGPRGSSQGLAALRQWAQDAHVTLQPGRMFVHDGVVVVQERATWPDSEPTTVATAFRVVDGQVVSVFRHDSLEDAFAGTGLHEGNEVDDGTPGDT